MRRPTVRCTERGCEFIALRRLADDANLTSRQPVKSFDSHLLPLALQTAQILPQVKANLPHSRTEFAVIYIKFAAVWQNTASLWRTLNLPPEPCFSPLSPRPSRPIVIRGKLAIAANF